MLSQDHTWQIAQDQAWLVLFFQFSIPSEKYLFVKQFANGWENALSIPKWQCQTKSKNLKSKRASLISGTQFRLKKLQMTVAEAAENS